MELKRIEKVENNLTWFALKAAVANGTVHELVRSGDMFPVTLKNGEAVELIATYDDNGKLFFVFNNCLNKSMTMNERYTNKGGWAASQMRRALNSDILALLPDEIQVVIAPTRIMQMQNGKEFVSEDKLFLLSKTQVFGTGDWSRYEPEDSPLDIFTGARSRVKEKGGYDAKERPYDDTTEWWLRSHTANLWPYSTYDFYSVNIHGTSIASGAFACGGVAPAFCL